MIFVFPMAGESSRFKSAGYKLPKYQLPIGSQDVLDMVLKPFLKFSSKNHFLFICKNEKNTINYIQKKCLKYSLESFSVVPISKKTSGQAETVYLGLKGIDHRAQLAIFNIDTFHLNFVPIDFDSLAYSKCDGLLEVFQDVGSNWSFAEVRDGVVVRTAEKNPISNLASNGLYYFRSVELFCKAYCAYFSDGKGVEKGERYIAPIYNQLINEGRIVRVKIIQKNDLIFCGIPQEYEQYCADITSHT